MSPEDRLPSLERRVDEHDSRIGRVEDSATIIQRKVAELETGMERLHGDLKVNNTLTANIDRSLTRIEENTKESLTELRSTVKEAVDYATTARTLGSGSVANIVGWVVAAVTAIVSLAVFVKGG